jgi:acyl-CoA thioester hydrolase
MTAPFRTTLRVRYAETDQMGVVYYANYFVWCEIGRVEFFRQLGHDYKLLEREEDCHLPVVDASCRYRSPARYDDEIAIETRVTVLRGPVMKFGYRILRIEADGEQLLAEAETVHVSVDKQMQKRNLPEKYALAIRGTME